MAFKVVPSRKDIEQFIERFVERKLKESRIDERINELRRVLGLDRKGAAKAVVAAAPPIPVEVKYEPVPAPKVVEKKAPAPEPVAEVKAAPSKKAPAKKAASKSAPAKKPQKATEADPLDLVLGALEQHPRKAALVKAGKQKDQLLRSLIPLYVARELDVEVSSGVASKFWLAHGVKFAAPNAAKVLREHTGYAKRTANGPQISAAGVKYVEDALAAK